LHKTSGIWSHFGLGLGYWYTGEGGTDQKRLRTPELDFGANLGQQGDHLPGKPGKNRGSGKSQENKGK